MKTLSKISATALFALFLTACDKPAEKPAAPAPAPQASQPVPAPQSDVNSLEQEKADFNALATWNNSQEKAQQDLVANFQQQLAEAAKNKDAKAVEAAISSYQGNVQQVIAGLDALNIKSDAINALKNQTKELLVLSNEVLAGSAKLVMSPNADLQKELQEKTTVLQQKVAAYNQATLDAKNKYSK